MLCNFSSLQCHKVNISLSLYIWSTVVFCVYDLYFFLLHFFVVYFPSLWCGNGEVTCIWGWLGKPEGTRPPERPRHRWDQSLTQCPKETGREGVDWIRVLLDRDKWSVLVSTVMDVWDPRNAGHFLASWGTVIFSRRTLLHVVHY